VGWYVHPYVAFLVGYKEVNFETSATSTLTSELSSTPGTGIMGGRFSFQDTSSSEAEISGPTLGIAGSVPIVGGFGIYASYAHGFMDVDISESFAGFSADFDADADYDVAELGFSYTPNMDRLLPHLPLSAATVYAGYRYQTVEIDIPDPNRDGKDVTQGFAAGLNLTW
jgi:hypothetical protein